jgi:hypothetical protein
MVSQGTVVRGVVVPDDASGLRDGMRVNIQPIMAPAAGPDRQGGFRPVGTWEGPPGELDGLIQSVQDLRDADVADEQEGLDDALSP